MMSKNYSSTGKKCRVTFKVPSSFDASRVHLVGDFNDWDPGANPMRKLKDGTFSTSVSLESGRKYRFRYLLDGARWENAPEADGTQPNDFGTINSIVEV